MRELALAFVAALWGATAFAQVPGGGGSGGGDASAANQTNGAQKTQIVDGSGNVIHSTANNLNVQCANCSGSGVTATDEDSFVAGTSLFAPGGGFFQTTATANPLTNGQQGFFQLTATRSLFTNLRNAAGTEVGTAGAPLQVSLANTGANGTAVSVAGTFFQATQPVSAVALPLPAGASTAALQPTNAAQASTTSGQTGLLLMGAVKTTPPSYTTAQTDPLSLDVAGNLRVNCITGCSGGGGGAITAASGSYAAGALSIGAGVDGWNLTEGAQADAAWVSGSGSIVAVLKTIAGHPLPTGAATSANQTNGAQKSQIVDGSGNVIASTSNNLNVQCANCTGSGVSATDQASFTAGASLFAATGGFFQTTATANPLTNGEQGFAQMTATRALFANLRNAAGAEVATAAVPLQVSLANTGANATAMLVTGTAGTFPITAAALPLPTGAATSANQTNGTQETRVLDGAGSPISSTAGNLDVQCANCSGSGVSTADRATFVSGTSLFAGGGGFFQTTATANPLTNGQQGMFQVTSERALFTNLRNVAGAEIGVAAAPLQVSLANTAANGTPIAVSGTFFPATQPISAVVLPLPTGASTSALQPTRAAIGSTTSGQTGTLIMGAVTTAAPSYTTAQTDALSLDVAGNLRVNCITGCSGGGGGNVTIVGPLGANAIAASVAVTPATSSLWPISAASLPLPALAATSTKQSDGTQKSQIVDGAGAVIASTSNALNVDDPTVVAAINTNSIPVPLPVSPATITWTQTKVSLAPATSATLIAANASRRALRWMNTGLNPVTVAPGGATVTAGNGFNYAPGSGVGTAGGFATFDINEVSSDSFSAISTLGTTVEVWEGQ